MFGGFTGTLARDDATPPYPPADAIDSDAPGNMVHMKTHVHTHTDVNTDKQTCTHAL